MTAIADSSSHDSRHPVLEATSIGGVARSRLKEGIEGTVQGTFDSAINVCFSGGLVSLVPEFIGRGPLNVTLQLPIGLSSLSPLDVRDGDKVRVEGFAMELSNRHLITFDSAEIYSPEAKFTLPMLSNNAIGGNLEVLRQTALAFGSMAGFGDLLELTVPGTTIVKGKKLNLFASAGLQRIIHLEQSFRSEEREAIGGAVRELIGLGPGLTPSSDDLLAGLVLMCILFGKNGGYEERAVSLVVKAIAEEAVGRTTALSEEYLLQAALGRGNEPVMRLCAELLTGGQESIEEQTKRVLSIGGSSGTDIVLGILLGGMFCIGRNSNLAQGDRNGH